MSREEKIEAIQANKGATTYENSLSYLIMVQQAHVIFVMVNFNDMEKASTVNFIKHVANANPVARELGLIMVIATHFDNWKPNESPESDEEAAQKPLPEVVKLQENLEFPVKVFPMAARALLLSQ